MSAFPTDSFPAQPAPERTRERPPPAIPDHDLLKKVGAGAYGEVWLARNSTGGYRAVKVIYRASFDHSAPFEREFAGIRHYEPVSRGHSGHLGILHVGIHEEHGYFFYIMEAADDETASPSFAPESYSPKTLHQEIQRRGPLPLDECLAIAVDLADALAYLHGEGLIHRDVKPSNIIYVRGRPRLADVGLVSPIDATASLVGTAGFMAPEGPSGPRADIFALGKVLYEMATGYDRTRFPEIPSSTQAGSIGRKATLAEVNQVILRACDIDPAKRYPSARAMGEDLRLVQRGESLIRLRRLERAAKRARRLLAVAGALALLGFVAYGYQLRHLRIVQTMADEKRQLADQLQEKLIASHVTAGTKEMDRGATHHALLSFARALDAAGGDPAKEAPQRIRLNALLSEHPTLLGVLEHQGWLRHSQFNPDGSWLLTAGDDGIARVWDAFSGQPVSAPMIHTGRISAASFSPSGRLILTAGGDGTAALWDAQLAEHLTQFHHGEAVLHGEFHPGGSLILTATADGARVWHPSGTPAGPDLRAGGVIHQALFTPDGSAVVTAGADGAVRFWDYLTGDLIRQPLPHPGQVHRARISPDGSRLATRCSSGAVFLWDLHNEDAAPLRLPHSAELVGLNFSPSGRLLVTGDRPAKTLRVWEVATGDLLLRLEGNVSTDPAFSPDGAHVAYSHFSTEARVVNIFTGQHLIGGVTSGWFDTAPFSPDGNRLAVPSTRAGIVRIWDLAGTSLHKLTLPVHDRINALAYSPDGRQIATAGNSVRVWDASSGNPITPPLPTEAPVARVEFSPDGAHVLAASGPFFINTSTRAWLHTHEVTLWDAATGREAFAPIIPGGCIRHATFTPDGSAIVTAGTRGEVRFWDARTGEAMPTVLKHGGPVNFFAISSDGRTLAVASGTSAHLWDVQNAIETAPPLAHRYLVEQVAFTPADDFLLTSSYHNQQLQLWDTTSPALLSSILAPGEIGQFAIDGAGKRLITSGFGCASLREIPSLASISEPRCHERALQFSALHPNAPLFLTRCAQWSRIWDAETGLELPPPSRRPSRSEDLRPVRRGIHPATAAFHPHAAEAAEITGPTTVTITRLEEGTTPAEDLLALALLIGTEPRPRNSPPPETGVAEAWRRLSQLYPERFSSRPAAVSDWHRHLALRLEEEDQPEAALWHWQRVAKIHPEDPEALRSLGRLHRQRGEWDTAIPISQRATEVGGLPRDYLLLALTHLDVGDLDAYRSAAHEMLDRFGTSRGFPDFVHAAWTSTLADGGNPDPAATGTLLAQRITAGDHGRNPEILIVQGALDFRAGNHRRARLRLERAIELTHTRPTLANQATQARVWAFLALLQAATSPENQTDYASLLRNWLADQEQMPSGQASDEWHELRLLLAQAEGSPTQTIQPETDN